MHRMLSVIPLYLLTLTACTCGMQLKVNAGSRDGWIGQAHVYPGCGGRNLPPGIAWNHVPAGTRSFVLTVFDTDANHGAGWWHWIVIDIPSATRALPPGARLPDKAHSLRNDFGQRGWGGPCPPAGDQPHHYVFTLYALDVPRLPVTADTPPAQAMKAMHRHVLGRARVIERYGR